LRVLEEELGASPVPIHLVNTLIISPFLVGNSSGVLIPRLFESYAREELIKSLRKLGINFGVIENKYTSLGNLILANDRGGVVSPILSISSRRSVAEVLDVEVVTTTIGRFSYVGSLAVSNNRGVLAAPVLKDDESKVIEDVLGIPIYTGTVNGGVEFISSGVVANDRGVVVGAATSGRELMVISQAFGVD
jgi:translation initiation factor 6